MTATLFGPLLLTLATSYHAARLGLLYLLHHVLNDGGNFWLFGHEISAGSTMLTKCTRCTLNEDEAT